MFDINVTVPIAEAELLIEALKDDPATRLAAAIGGWPMPLDRWIDMMQHARTPGATWPWDDRAATPNVTDEAMARARAIAATC